MTTLNEFIRHDHSLVILTGAGISVPSGIPPFRGKNGLYQNADVERCLSIRFFRSHPSEFWTFYRSLFDTDLLLQAKPNPVHFWIRALENEHDVTVITQNIDGLHINAGSTNVIEVHGAFRRCVCPKCGALYETRAIQSQKVPQCSALVEKGKTCGTVLKPDIVLFGESVHGLRDVELAVSRTDRLLVLGTSLGVAPINVLPEYAKEFGVPTLLVNDRPALQMEAISNYVQADFNNFNADAIEL